MIGSRALGFIVTVMLFCGCKTVSESGVADALATDVECEIVIVGGGVGGLHTAYRLGPKFGGRVCLFEKNTRLGGRIYDISKTELSGDGPYIGNGGRRVMVGQEVVFNLAKELGIELEKPQTGADLVFARGKYSTHKDDFVKLYKGLEYDKSQPDVETQLLTKLLSSPERRKVDEYPDFKSYVIKVVGQVGYQYLHDMNRFRGDFEYPLSARGYLDFLEEELNVCCQTYYPVGGMSAFVRAFEAQLRSQGVRIFMSEPVNTIDKGTVGYVLNTSKRKVWARRVIISVPPQGLANIGGAVAERIKARQEFKDLLPIRVTVINQWFDKAWWKDLHTREGQEVWRAYTTGHCINFAELPPENYAVAQKVIRTVYNDQANCAQMWADLANVPGEFEDKLHEGLVHLFSKNGVTTPVTIPQATRTTFWEWPDGWYLLKAGSRFSNADILEWAVEPLKGEDVGLVSEGYNPQRAAWTDGAYKASIKLLNAKYGMSLPGLTKGGDEG